VHEAHATATNTSSGVGFTVFSRSKNTFVVMLAEHPTSGNAQRANVARDLH
jgi:hypothetical protein